jgi:hypothetical protein
MLKKSKGLLIGITASLAAVAAIGALLIVLFIGGSSESVLKKYIEAGAYGDSKTALKLLAYDFDYLFKESAKNRGETVSSYYDAMAQGAKSYVEMTEEHYGKNYKVSHEIKNTKILSSEEIQKKIDDIVKPNLDSYSAADDLDKSKILNIDKITEMIEYKVETTIKGSKGEKTNKDAYTMIKINNKWRILDLEDLREEL